VTSSWTARYPDLTGKAVVVAGDSPGVTEVVRGLAANGALLAVVSANRSIVEQAVAVAESLDATVNGMTADPSSPAVWERIRPHIEQRLGPIDVVVALGGAALRRAVTDALLPDMIARHRGVLVEIDTHVELASVASAPGVRHRGIQLGSAAAELVPDTDVAAAVLLCASDTMTVPAVLISAGQAPG
jgi:hypothetical protein